MWCNHRRQRFKHLVHHLRLDPDHQDIWGQTARFAVQRQPVILSQIQQRLAGPRVHDNQIVGRQPGIKPTTRQGNAHLAGTNQHDGANFAQCGVHASPTVSNITWLRASAAVLPAQTTNWNA